MANESVADSKSPLGGRYVALLRRTATGVLFSDPIFVAQDHTLPELPDGLQYIVIHPSSIPSSALLASQPAKAASGSLGKSYTMKAYLPASDTKHRVQYAMERLYRTEALLPAVEDYGQFSSFLPAKDSLASTLPSTFYTTPTTDYGMDCQETEESGGAKEAVAVSPSDLSSAICAAEKILSSSDDNKEPRLSLELLSDLGLNPADLEEAPRHTAPEPPSDQPETAQSVLRENDRLLARLLELQDRRAASGDFDQIGHEEMAVANQLQINLARVAAAQAPSALRPSVDSIHSAAAMLLAKDQGSYSGTLPPQRRYAFISNAAANAGFPQAATMAPMQQRPQGIAK
ncbi:hypothetical protein LPJ75_000855 [Coemansia sp. RSA 2598]|nr:hypothetical protein LPJ75_000855 [Coemansia sp. RSA 2598]